MKCENYLDPLPPSLPIPEVLMHTPPPSYVSTRSIFIIVVGYARLNKLIFTFNLTSDLMIEEGENCWEGGG